MIESTLGLASRVDRILRAGPDAWQIASRVPLVNDSRRLADVIWEALAPPNAPPRRKALVFVRSRRACDELTEILRNALSARRHLFVGSHHGSLARRIREEVEDRFHAAADAVVVATPTLELGIDIGDVDIVVLVGPPPDVASLLQRVGRGGRRTGQTLVLPVASDDAERLVFASMIEAARSEMLDRRIVENRPSVVVQQWASYLMQASDRRRPEEALLELTCATWGPAWRERAQALLRHLAETEVLPCRHGRYELGERLGDMADRVGVHTNIAGGFGRYVLVDHRTGESVAEIDSVDAAVVRVASISYRVVGPGSGRALLVEPLGGVDHAAAPRYPTRRFPGSAASAQHLGRALGFEPRDVAIAPEENAVAVYHFAGSAVARLIAAVAPTGSIVSFDAFGWVLAPGARIGAIQREAGNAARIEEIARGLALRLEEHFDPGPFTRYLPDDSRTSFVLLSLALDEVVSWVQRWRIVELRADDPRRAILGHILS